MEKEKKTSGHRFTASFKTGAIAAAFLIIGYEAALFIHSAALAGLVSHRDSPDTVYVVDGALAREILGERSSGQENTPEVGSESHAVNVTPARDVISVRRDAEHSQKAEAMVSKARPRKVENFFFDPNTVSVKDLQRLGFSPGQAGAIENYRTKGGRFNRPSDFAKSYVVSDSVFKRLEPYIRIPKVNINSADSAVLVRLPGIGPYFASRIVEYREEHGPFTSPEQLLEIYRFDAEKLESLRDLITLDPE